MSWRTSPTVIAVRTLARRVGINSLLGRFAGRSGYEQAFNTAVFAAIAKGDAVWDVGANVGYYTEQFGNAVGPTGAVCAFEPSPINYARLATAVSEYPNIKLFAMGLGDRRSTLKLRQGADSLGATSQIVEQVTGGESVISVEISTADQLIESGNADIPNFIKIDVEGFELEVLKGMPRLLRDSKLRAIGMEVHFGLLAERGMSGAAKEIERLLQAGGFSCKWVDPSHVFAQRR